MSSTGNRHSGIQTLFALASFVILIAGLKAMGPIIVPFVFALFLAFLASAFVDILERYELPRGIAVLIVAILLIVAIALLLLLFIGSAESFLVTLPEYWRRIESELEALIGSIPYLSAGSSTDLNVSLSALIPLARDAVTGTVSGVSSFILMMIFFSFLLTESRAIRVKLEGAFGSRIDISSFEEVSEDVKSYLLIKTGTSALTGLLIAAWTLVMGVPFFVLWGILAFFLNFIPVVGSIVAAIPALIIVLAEYGTVSALIVAGGYIVVNVTVSNLIEPIYLGRGLGLSPLVVFIFLVFWGWVWGPAGMLLSIPLAMLIKIILAHSDDFNWIAVLMGTKVKEPSA